MSSKARDDNDFVQQHGHAEFDPIEQAVPFDEDQATPESAMVDATQGWAEPQPLRGALLPVAPFDPAMMPEPFRPWLVDVAHRLQAPPDFPAIGVIVSLASVIGRGVGIRPKQRDSWTVAPNLWSGIVAEPGMQKSPCLKEALVFINRLTVRAGDEHQHALEAPRATSCLKRQKSNISSKSSPARSGNRTEKSLNSKAMEKPTLQSKKTRAKIPPNWLPKSPRWRKAPCYRWNDGM